jgi:nucleotide-binding universal stress UspA family protein
VIKERRCTHILIPTEGSELAGKAVQHGIALAKRVGAKVTMLTVFPSGMITTDRDMMEIRKCTQAEAC